MTVLKESTLFCILQTPTTAPLFHPTSFSVCPLTLNSPLPPSPHESVPLFLPSPPPAVPPSHDLSLFLSLRHGQGRISRQSQAVQTQLYDRKNPPALREEFPLRAHTLMHTYLHAKHTQPDMLLCTHMHVRHTHTHIHTGIQYYPGRKHYFFHIQCFHSALKILSVVPQWV